MSVTADSRESADLSVIGKGRLASKRERRGKLVSKSH